MIDHGTFNICIGGYTQTTGRRSGLFRCWDKLLTLQSPETSVWLFKWNAPWWDVAEQIFLLAENLKTISINTFAYSYGVGWGFLRLAYELGRRGLEINTAVLCDGIRRMWSGFKWLAMTDWPVIWVPTNVNRVIWFYQRQSRPRGHKVVAVDPNLTKITPEFGILLHADHQWADDAPAFHDAVMEVAWAGRRSAVPEVLPSNAPKETDR